MTINTSKLAPFELRKWQKVAIERSNRPYSGIFLEAAGGKGKTIASLALLIIDEWQNMSSDNLIKAYTKINAKYRIGLSATPMRKAGQNFYGLEKTLWGKANPNQVFNWRSTHGILVEDRFSYSKYKWTEFRNYDTYI